MNSVNKECIYNFGEETVSEVSIRNEAMLGDLNRLGIMSWQVFVSSGLNQPVLLLYP